VPFTESNSSGSAIQIHISIRRRKLLTEKTTQETFSDRRSQRISMLQLNSHQQAHRLTHSHNYFAKPKEGTHTTTWKEFSILLPILPAKGYSTAHHKYRPIDAATCVLIQYSVFGMFSLTYIMLYLLWQLIHRLQLP